MMKTQIIKKYPKKNQDINPKTPQTTKPHLDITVKQTTSPNPFHFHQLLGISSKSPRYINFSLISAETPNENNKKKTREQSLVIIKNPDEIKKSISSKKNNATLNKNLPYS